jgi:DNA-binding FadR family transcriptional regulator
MDPNEIREGMIMMKEGQVITVRNGELVLMEEEATMPDGTRVMPDGTVLTTDGKTRTMIEGETLRLVGEEADAASIPEMGSTEETTGTETHDPS